MQRSRRARTLAGVAVAVLVHVVFLAAVAFEVGAPSIREAGEGLRAVSVTILAPQPPPKPERERSRPSSPVAARAAPPAAVPAPVAALPAPAPPPAAPAAPAADAGPSLAGFGKAVREGPGCLHPDEFHQTAAERAHCLKLLADQGRAAPDWSLVIPPGKLRGYARDARCHEMQVGGGVPIGTDTSHGMAGMGYVPGLRECPPGSR